MSPGNADLIRPLYDEWGRGNWRRRFDVYHPRMEWGWSDDFPGLAGVYEDHEDPNPRLLAWLSEWEQGSGIRRRPARSAPAPRRAAPGELDQASPLLARGSQDRAAGQHGPMEIFTPG
jgi:hypothetical protein